MTAIPSLPPRKTLNGLFDAYCHVCWNPVYVLWIDKTDPQGKCPHGGHTNPLDCPDVHAAAQWAKAGAEMKRIAKEQREAMEQKP